MKLRNLNAAIRRNQGAVKVKIPISPALSPVTLEISKQRLLAALKEAAPPGDNPETYLTISHEGVLTRDTSPALPGSPAAPPKPPAAPPKVINLEDLL